MSIILLLLGIASACVQVTPIAIRNSNSITDTFTPTDEIQLKFGVGAYFAYSLRTDFAKNQVITIPPKSISFPCMYDKDESGLLWIELHEHDDWQNDVTKIGINCTYLQLGDNTIDVPLYENEVFTKHSALFMKKAFKVKYLFGKQTGTPSMYSIDLKVEETCTGLVFDDEVTPWLKGRLHNIFPLPDELAELIRKQEQNDRPALILSDGQILNTGNGAGFNDFLKSSYELPDEDGELDEQRSIFQLETQMENETFPAWMVVVLVIGGLGFCGFMAIIFYVNRQKSQKAQFDASEALAREMEMIDQQFNDEKNEKGKEGKEIGQDSFIGPGSHRSRMTRKSFGDANTSSGLSPIPMPLKSLLNVEHNQIAPMEQLLQGRSKDRDSVRTTFVPINELPARKDYKEKTPQGQFVSANGSKVKTEKRPQPQSVQQTKSRKFDSMDLQAPIVPESKHHYTMKKQTPGRPLDIGDDLDNIAKLQGTDDGLYYIREEQKEEDEREEVDWKTEEDYHSSNKKLVRGRADTDMIGQNEEDDLF